MGDKIDDDGHLYLISKLTGLIVKMPKRVVYESKEDYVEDADVL